jgi:pimeloyl-ACP methyl ester carboxylesterase
MIPVVTERLVRVEGRAVRYLEAGSGRPLVLVHAFPFSAEMWRFQLEHAPGGWRFIAPDLQGFGGTERRSGDGPTMDDFAADVEGLLDALGIDRAAIGGLSMGGYITFALFRRAPERFAAMVLADTRAPADTPEGRQGRAALATLVREKGATGAADQLLPKLLGETTRRSRPEVVARARAIIEACAPDAIVDAIQALLGRPDSTPDLARIGCPTLIIVGDEDVITPLKDSESMHGAIAGSQLVVLPGTGHLSNLEVPEVFSNALGGFLARL